MELQNVKQTLSFISGTGEMKKRIEEFDWSSTPLGDIDSWSHSLKTTVAIMVSNRFPMLLWWGNEYISIYNDAYIPVLGDKHPWALGKPVKECWNEIWHILQPLIDTPYKGGEATWMEDLSVDLKRFGFLEETHFTIAYSPVPDETVPTRIGGVIATVTEITEMVIGQRRLNLLREIGVHATVAKSKTEACRLCASTIADHARDIPFALFYLFDENKTTARLICSTGIGVNENISPSVINLADKDSYLLPFEKAISNESIEVVPDFESRFKFIQKKFFTEPVHTALVIPIPSNKAHRTEGLMIAGTSPRLKFDNSYKSFFDVLVSQISSTIANANAFEEERHRAEKLAEIDKAKTVFFSNISHEFRTPLTLMLSPLEEIMHKSERLSKADKQNLDTTHRNAIRLLKLVNTLLDFSRIESGRQQANFSLVDIVALTKNLASNFRSVIEKAGLSFNIIAENNLRPVYVDKQMWEKIVFNLLSNAFKYTMNGSIAVQLKSEDDFLVLNVIDTGTGIPENELPHMFERFHRIQNVTGRTYEGTGIGLSLIRELVKQHNGEISVLSELGKGSTFTVRIPFGNDHHDQSQARVNNTASHSIASDAFIEEAELLLPRPKKSGETNSPKTDGAPTILVVDDNADMREHIRSILSDHFRIIVASQGHEALRQMTIEKPDLVLTDIMMPVMDGIELLKEIKGNRTMAHIPVILLTARAGEESKIEGIETGADDYLIKPFSGRELISRINSQIHTLRIRSDAQKEMYNIFKQAPVSIVVFRGEDYKIELANDAALKIWDMKGEDVIGKPVNEVFPASSPAIQNIRRHVYKTGESYFVKESPVTMLVDGKETTRFFDFNYTPLRDYSGKITGVVAIETEVTESVISKKEHEKNAIVNSRLAAIVQSSEDAIISKTLDGVITSWNPGAQKLFGYSAKEMIGQSITKIIPENRLQEEPGIIKRIQDGEIIDHFDTKRLTKSGKLIDISLTISPIRDNDGIIVGASKIARDITHSKQAQDEIRESNNRYKELSETLEKKVSERTRELTMQKDFLNTIIDATPALIGAYDTNLRIIAFNKACEDMLNLKAADVIGKTYFEVFPGQEESKGLSDLKRALKGETVNNDVYFSPITKRYFQNILTPLKDDQGNIYAAIAIANDITEIIQNTAKIQQSEEKFNKLFSASPLGLTLTEIPSGRHVDVNEVHLRTIGYSREEYIGKTPLEMKLIEQSDREKINKELQEKGFLKNHELIIRKKSGEKIPALLSIEEVSIGDGKYNLMAIIDISDRKKAEQEIQHANTELQKMNKELESFAYVSSHDLQEPLRKIQTFAIRLLDRETDHLSEKGKDYFNRMIQSANRMQVLIDDILSFSRISTTERKFEKIHLNKLINDVLKEYKEEIREMGAELHIGEMCELNIIAFQFRQLFDNLISNAFKFSKPGEKPVIKIDSEIIDATGLDMPIKCERVCKITFSDNGIGFEPQFSEKIFEMFQRLHGKSEYPGTGIGLSIVKKVVETHNGRVEAESELGKGARFTLYLPYGN